MIKYFFKEYKKLHDDKESIYRSKMSVVAWILFILSISSIIVCAISELAALANNFNSFWMIIFACSFLVSIILMPLTIYISERRKNNVFKDISDYLIHCEKIKKIFNDPFRVTKTEHYEGILNDIKEAKSRLYNESRKPFETLKSFIKIVVSVFTASVIPAVIQKTIDNNNNYDFHIVSYACDILIIIMIISAIVGAVLYVDLLNKQKELRYYEDFENDIKVVIDISNGYYDGLLKGNKDEDKEINNSQ